jgi:hypothetical protein
MYPGNKTLAVFGKEAVWPGLEDGRFSNGSFEDPLVPPSFIPAETLNLILDNLGELVAGLRGTPDNTDPGQVAAAVKGALDALKNETETELALKAPLDSPVFTGTPEVPGKTGAAADSGTLVATEAQVYLKADRESPALTGTPTAPTPEMTAHDTRIATTAFTHAAAKYDAWPVGSFYTQYPLPGPSDIAGMFPYSLAPATLFSGMWTEMYAGEKVFFMGGLSSVESNRCGGVQEDAIRNITGRDGHGWGGGGSSGSDAASTYGCFTNSGNTGSQASSHGSDRASNAVVFDASRQVPVDTTNHPKNRPVKVWRRTA